MDFLLSIPAWMPPAIIAGGCGIAALVVYALGAAQGYTNQDYRDYRSSRKKARRNKNRNR